MSNIVGEKFEGFVKNQIQIRQKLLGKGLNSNNLSNQDLNIINNRNAWLKPNDRCWLKVNDRGWLKPTDRDW